MNDETPSPTSPNGDDPVEARIVAWVLGETSADESAEIERLCEQRTELRSFSRRMRSLHGLLIEAETPDDSWKLPTEKRKKLDDIFLSPTIPFVRKKAVAKRSLLTIAASIALLLAVTGIIASTLVRKNSESNITITALPQTAPQVDVYALRTAVRDQEGRVEERRKVLRTIARNEGIIFRDESGVDADQSARNLLSHYNGLELERMQLESQIATLEKYEGDQLKLYASDLDLPNNLVKSLYPVFLEAKRKFEAEKTNSSVKDSASVLAKSRELTGMDQQITQEIIAMQSTLQGRLEKVSEQLVDVQTFANQEVLQKVTQRGFEAKDFLKAKKDFDNEVKRLADLKAKLEQAKGDQPSTAKP